MTRLISLFLCGAALASGFLLIERQGRTRITACVYHLEQPARDYHPSKLKES